MIKKTSLGFMGICLAFMWALAGNAQASQYDDPTQETLVELATCLTEKGWVMYSSFTCSACRAQRKAFGDAFQHIEEVECNPNAPNNQVERCLKTIIKKTPTWVLEKEGEEIKRFEGYQLIEDLASTSGCAR